MPIVLAIPVVIEGVAVGGAWAYRGYQLYRAYRAAKALEAVIAAQNAANADAATQEKAKTDAQAKADTAAGCQGGNCDEDPDCETARSKLKEALYGIKDDTSDSARGLAERLCHWLHGSDETLRASHLKALQQAAARVKNAREWLTEGGDRPYGKKEGATLSKKDKDKKLKDCNAPPEAIKDAKDLEDLAQKISENRSPIRPIPDKDFAVNCAKNALGLVNRAFGR